MTDAELIDQLHRVNGLTSIGGDVLERAADLIEVLSVRLKVAEEGLQHIAEYGRANPGYGYSCATKALSVLSQFRKEVG